MKIRYAIFIILSCMFFLFAAPSLAAVLEVGIPGQEEAAPGADLPTLEQYMRYVYFFMLGTVGIAAFISLVWYGVMWIYSGIVEKKSEALEGIKNTFIGLGLAFGAYIILYTVNPDIVSLRAPTLSPIDATQTEKETAGTPTATPIVPTPTGSLQTLASEIPASYLRGFDPYLNRWKQCSASFKGTKTPVVISPAHTFSQVKDVTSNGYVTSCRAGCSDTYDPINGYCTMTLPISSDMIKSIWAVINTGYAPGFKPSFTIIEIVGGDRVINHNTGMHYGGRAIDVVPTADDTPNEYVKIISAFRNAGATKTVCVNDTETQEDETCGGSWKIDHIHIEW